jgi:hypothetical protein
LLGFSADVTSTATASARRPLFDVCGDFCFRLNIGDDDLRTLAAVVRLLMPTPPPVTIATLSLSRMLILR